MHGGWLALALLGCGGAAPPSTPPPAPPAVDTAAPTTDTPDDSASTDTAPVEDTVDTGCDAVTRYRDLDADGYGGDAVEACEDDARYVDTPGDCDDRDDRIHPRARDACNNGVDEDCDGVDAACRVVRGADGVRMGHGSGAATVLAVGELAEGVPALLAGAPDVGDMDMHDGTAAMYPAPLAAGANPTWVGYCIRCEQRLGTAFALVDDLDGDGLRDVAVAAPGRAYDKAYDGSVWLYSAVSASSGGSLIGSLWSERSNVGDALSAGDLDGDGAAELVVEDIGVDGAGEVWITPAQATSVEIHDEGRLVSTDPDDAGNGLTVAADQDLDGDGQADLVVGMPARGAVSLLAGPIGASGHVDDGVVLTGVPGLGDALVPVDDVDGDGRGDLLVAGELAGVDRPLRVISGAGATPGPVDAATVAEPDLGGTARPCKVGDLDGDGFAELGSTGSEDVSWVLYGPALDFADRAIVSGVGGGACAGGVDLTGDGVPDVAIADPLHLWVFSGTRGGG